jgi:hypothetical protein
MAKILKMVDGNLRSIDDRTAVTMLGQLFAVEDIPEELLMIRINLEELYPNWHHQLLYFDRMDTDFGQGVYVSEGVYLTRSGEYVCRE